MSAKHEWKFCFQRMSKKKIVRNIENSNSVSYMLSNEYWDFPVKSILPLVVTSEIKIFIFTVSKNELFMNYTDFFQNWYDRYGNERF